MVCSFDDCNRILYGKYNLRHIIPAEYIIWVFRKTAIVIVIYLLSNYIYFIKK